MTTEDMIDELIRRKQAAIRLHDNAIESLRTLGGLAQGDLATVSGPSQSNNAESTMMLSDESKRAVVERQKARWAEWKRSDEAN